MPLNTLERNAPSLFKQGPSARSQLILYSALALFLMVADARLHLTEGARKAVGALLYPVQWVMLQPVQWAGRGGAYFMDLQHAQSEADAARREAVQLGQRALQVEQLAQENARLRALLGLRERLTAPGQAAQVLYDVPDTFARRVVIDRGQLGGVQPGAPVLDERGVLGQVTRVFPMLSEVTLLIDRDQAIPVLNVRTGARSVAYGDPVAGHRGGMELRFVPSNADVQEGDLLTTSGVDGLYPPGLAVARVLQVERRADSAFMRIFCQPLSQVQGARHVIVLQPPQSDLPAPPPPEPPAGARRGGRK